MLLGYVNILIFHSYFIHRFYHSLFHFPMAFIYPVWSLSLNYSKFLNPEAHYIVWHCTSHFWLIEVLSFSISSNAFGISLCFNTYFLYSNDALFSYSSSCVLKIDFPGMSLFTACLSAVWDFVLLGISSTLSAIPMLLYWETRTSTAAD